MKSRILSLVLAIVLVVAGVPLSASAATSGTCGDNLTWELDDKGILTISGTGAMYSYSSTFSSGTLPPWRSSKGTIKEIYVQEGVTDVGSYAFMDYPKVTKVELASTVNKINEGAFRDCTALVDISFLGVVKVIGDTAFENCIKFTTFTVPSGTESLGYCCFWDCTALESITLPISLKSIARMAFFRCGKFTDVYYEGSQEQWNEIDRASNNTELNNATIHFGNTEPMIVDYDNRVTFDGHTYHLFNKSKTWEEAKEYCEELGGHLVTITDEAEMKKVEEALKDTDIKYFWMGGYSVDGGWYWITGESWGGYENWFPGEPSKEDTDGTKEDCLCLWNVDDNGWTMNDQRDDLPSFTSAQGRIGYICEYESIAGYK